MTITDITNRVNSLGDAWEEFKATNAARLKAIEGSDFPLRDKCEEKAANQNIPHFTLLACDNFACDLVEQWLEKAKEANISEAKYKEALELALVMRAWRMENPDLCKNPD